MHVRCPHCHNAIEFAADGSLSDIACPSCGSSFNLLSEIDTLSRRHEKETIGHFQLVQRLGMGSFGEVWRAQDTQLDRQVAVKIPRKGQLNAEETEKFLREARAAAQLKHPSIVSVHEVGRESDQVYIVSDLVRGVTLADRLTTGPLSAPEAVDICTTVAEALHHAHEAGVVHRDLKPSNIMLDDQGQPHVMDFGLAKREAGEITMTVEGQLIGTPAYMSPEQAQGDAHDADRRSDVYSLGVILFELLTGERPYRGNQRMLLHQVIHEEAPSARTLNSTVPRDLDTICAKCLQKDPARRYATGQEMAEDLSRWRRSEPILARPVSRWERGWRWCQRNPGIATLAASLVIVLVTGLVTVTTLWRKADASATREQTARTQLQGQQDAVNRARQVAEANEQQAKAAREAAALRARRYRYLTDMERARRAWRDSQIKRAQMLLDDHRPIAGQQDLRTFEWHLLSGLCRRGRLTLEGHEGDLSSIAFSPDGSWLATASVDGTVRLWRPTTGARGAVLRGHTDGIMQVRFSPNNLHVATAGRDKTIRIWDLNGNQVKLLSEHEHPVFSLTFTADGKRLISGAGTVNVGEVKIWDLESAAEETTLTGYGASVAFLTLSDDEKVLATGTRGFGTSQTAPQIKIWDMESQEELTDFATHSGQLSGFAFLADNETLVTGGYEGTTRPVVAFWNSKTGEKKSAFPLDDRFAVSVAFSHDRQKFAVATGQEVIVGSLEDGTIQKRLTGHSGIIAEVAFSPDGQSVATAAKAGDTTAKLWDLDAPDNPQVLRGHSGWVSAVAVNQRGNLLATASRTMHFRDVTGAEILLWKAATGELVRSIPAKTRDVYGLALSPDGKTLASSGEDRVIRLWDTETGEQVVELTGHEVPVTDLAFSPDGSLLASADGEFYRVSSDYRAMDTFNRPGKVRIWDVADRKAIHMLDSFSHSVTALAFAPQAPVLATGTQGGDVHLWNPTSGEQVRHLKVFSAKVTVITFNSDGSLLAVAGMERGPSDIGDVKLFDPSDGSAKGRLIGHDNLINAMAFSPDGKTLVTGGWDSTIRFWDPILQLERVLLPVQQVNALAFSADGTYLVTGSNNRTVQIWRARPPWQ